MAAPKHPANKIYSPKISQKVISLVTKGVPLEEIGAMRGMPGSDTIRSWFAKYPVFKLKYDKAREGYQQAGAPREPFNETIAYEIIDRLGKGESLNKIVEDPHMPTLTVVYSWRRLYSEFAEAYSQARLDQADSYADKIAVLPDKCREELKTIQDPRLSNAWKETYRLEQDGLKWIASKLKPQAYGDKAQVDINTQVKIVKPEGMKKGKASGLGRAEAAKVL